MYWFPGLLKLGVVTLPEQPVKDLLAR